MTFIWPSMLWLLLLIPLGVFTYLQNQKRRKKLIEKFSGLGLTQHIEPRRHVPPAIFLFSLAILIFSLARPQAVVSLPKQEGTIILAFDVSGSMAADDLKPTRLAAAKVAAEDFIKRQPPYVQIGVVAFSDGGFSVQLPTNDQGAILAAINRLTPQRGTSIANGILVSLKAINPVTTPPPESYTILTPAPTPTPTPMPAGTYTNAAIVLLTDGENNENPDPLAAAQEAADRGVRIYTVGIGSVTGTNVHINGFTLHTQLYEDPLKQISQITGGTYYNAQSTEELIKIYDNLNTQISIKPEKTELTSIFAGAGILVLLVGGLFSLLWFGRLP